MHMNITHLPLILRFISLLSVSPTGPGSNPNSGSGLQSGVWILAGCQRRYAWSPLPGTGGVWRMSENVFLLFPLLPHCCYSLHLLCTSSFLLLSGQTAILSFILMFLAQHTNIHFLSGLGLDILKTGSCETPERRSAVLDSQRCSYLTYTHSYTLEECPHWFNQSPPHHGVNLLFFYSEKSSHVWELGSSGYIYIYILFYFSCQTYKPFNLVKCPSTQRR